jgi:hypothetical protein
MNLILSTENEAKLGNWFVISGRRQAAGGGSYHILFKT